MNKVQYGLAMLGYSLLPRNWRRNIDQAVQRQKDILSVMCVLPGKYRYEQVEAAINAAGVHPRDIYASLSAGEPTLALARFYEALRGLGSEVRA